ncbi:potassium channel family protein [Arcobacter peruensis]|uniref:potassium channel family protein n=1 Tax=Arcobacter peruensis TaxID=2320140 RepID=UPI000F07E6B1|nr:potassium channel family protein [Arcobacter peruensis]
MKVKKLLLNFLNQTIDLFFFILLKIQSFMFTFSDIRKSTQITMLNITKKREGNKIYLYFRYLFMPTRLYSEIIKENDPDNFLNYMEKMTRYSLITSSLISLILLLGSLYVDKNILMYFYSVDNIFVYFIAYALCVFILLWSISRIIEITYAFINDARTHLEIKEPTSNIPYFKRIHLAMISYIELIILFAILYFCIDSLSSAFNLCNLNMIDLIYFSGVTITTLGYGDIQPDLWLTKLLSIIEVICGFTLIIVSFTVYVSRAINDLNK